MQSKEQVLHKITRLHLDLTEQVAGIPVLTFGTPEYSAISIFVSWV